MTEYSYLPSIGVTIVYFDDDQHIKVFWRFGSVSVATFDHGAQRMREETFKIFEVNK